MWAVYILECRNGLLYTGATSNLAERIKKHNGGKGARFTRANRPCELIWHEHYLDRSKAQKREREIKG